MDVLVCVKRVPAPGGRIVLTDDQRAIDTRHLGFTISPHEECAVEEAVRIVERLGGTSTVLTLGGEESEEQLRQAIALGIDHGVLVEADEADLDPQALARALTDAIGTLAEEGQRYDLILFGNESADAGNHQVGVRVAHALGLPVVAGIKRIDVEDRVTLRREIPDGFEVYELPLPAAVGVKEGLNLPRYPSMTGRLRARKAEIRRIVGRTEPGGLERIRFVEPERVETETVLLGSGPEAAPGVVDVIEELGLLR
jgi:electron transfer flavoprotein beta subunit